MNVVRIDKVQKQRMSGATPVPGWSGGEVSRSRQVVIPDGGSENYKCNVVNFDKGATTGWHAHDCDQILVVTSGEGIVATEQEEQAISVGDVVHIKAGEKHWHGANAETSMSHITVTVAGSVSKH